MDEIFSFQETILFEKHNKAFEDGDMIRHDNIGEQLRKLQNAHEAAEVTRHIRFLKHAAGVIMSHFVELEVPKVKLISRTINIIDIPVTKSFPKTNPDSLSTVATGWVLYSSESEFKKSDSTEPVFSGYLINKSKTIFGFRNGQIAVDKGNTSYIVSKYSNEYLSMTKDLHKPYADFDEAVVGDIYHPNYRDYNQRSSIESVLAHVAIDQGLEKKIISTWQPMIYNQG